jgi:transketolase
MSTQTLHWIPTAPIDAPPDLTDRIRAAKLLLLRMHYQSGVGHIGGNLSSLDILMSLFHVVMTPEDRFVLSKGHSAGALYVALATAGRIPEDELATFHKNGTRLSGHPPPNTFADIVFATGSLGHGMPLANGLALAKVLRNQPGRVYCLMSDGECQEGSSWEGLIFAAHRDLPITAIIDANGLQGFGTTKDIASMDGLEEKLSGFGIKTCVVDGHSPTDIIAACAADPTTSNALSDSPFPLGEGVRGRGFGFRVIVAQTRKGAGVSFMENKMEWHYLPLTEALYADAVSQVENVDQ